MDGLDLHQPAKVNNHAYHHHHYYYKHTEPIQCPRLVDPENGDVSFRQTVGSIAVYKCNKGFTLIGNEKRTCQQNGAWTGQQPTCKCMI